MWHHDYYRITDSAVCDANGTALLWWAKRRKLQLIEHEWECAVFEDEARTREVLTLHRYMRPGFSAVWDVTETATGRLVGRSRRPSNLTALRRWYEIMDSNDQPLGELVSTTPVVILMLLSDWLPQTNELVAVGQVAATVKRGPWWDRHCDVVPSASGQHALDPCLHVVAGLVLQQNPWWYGR